MELLQFYAHTFCELSETLGVLRVFLYNEHDLSSGQLDSFGWAVKTARDQCARLELPTSLDQCEAIQYAVSHRDDSFSLRALSGLIRELQSRITSELKRRTFVAVAISKADYYRQDKPLFGELVAAKFSQMAEDISEAGKCLALNRSTAAVFHLMRIMEIGVQRFGNKLGVPLVAEINWQVILDQVNAKIKKLNAKDSLTKQYAEAASHLYNVKLAWRNEVMHPKQTYTDEEADKIFRNVGTFVSDLAALV